MKRYVDRIKLNSSNISKILNINDPIRNDIKRDNCDICGGDDILYEDSNYVCKNCGSTQIEFNAKSLNSIDTHEFNTYSYNGNISDNGSVLTDSNLKLKFRFMGRSSRYGSGYILRNDQSCYLDGLFKKLSTELENYMINFIKRKAIRKLFKNFPDYKEEILIKINTEKKNIDPVEYVLKNYTVEYAKPDNIIIKETITLFMKVRKIKTCREKKKWGVIAGCLRCVSKKHGIIYRSSDLCEIFNISIDYLNRGNSFITKRCSTSFELNKIFIEKNKIFLNDYKDAIEVLFPNIQRFDVINMFINRLINTKYDNQSTAPSVMAWILKSCQMKFKNFNVTDDDIKNVLSVSPTIIQRYKNISVYIYI